MPSYGNNVKIVAQGNDTLYVSQWASNGAVLLKSENAGLDWKVVFATYVITTEYIHDIAISTDGTVFISLTGFGYSPDGMGGLYKSTNGGDTWELLGLHYCSVQNLKLNKKGDLFIRNDGGPYQESCGLMSIYYENPQIIECLYKPHILGLVINLEGHIYASTVSSALIKSMDNGLTFEYVDKGLLVLDLAIDNNDYLYGFGNKLYKSKTPTSVSINDNIVKNKNALKITPNPTSCIIEGTIDIIPIPINNHYNYKITDMEGRTVTLGKVATIQGEFQMDVRNLTHGIYIYSISINNKTYSAKIIKY